MTRTMFEHHECVFTTNKALGWATLVSSAGPIWRSGKLALLQSAVDRLTPNLMESREMILAERKGSAELEARVSVLENSCFKQEPT